MKRLLLLLLAFLTISVKAQPGAAASRVMKNDPSKLRAQPKIHDGAGTMAFTQLFGGRDVSTNLMYLHAGVMNPNSSIGEHFHHSMEEMYVLLEGEAEFTINGRRSLIKAPALVPCKLGDAHGLYNTSGKTVKWLNFGIGKSKNSGGGVFNLGDPLTPGTNTLDAIPQFVSGRLERDKLRANPNYTGNGVVARRIFNPDVFQTEWNNVDHVVIPAGVAMGPRSMEGFEDIYYVVNGSGTVDLNGKKFPIGQDDAFCGLLGEKVNIASTDKELELLVISIAVDKTKLVPQRGFAGGPGAAPGAVGGPRGGSAPMPAATAPAAAPKAMLLQMDFVVEAQNAEAFEKMYTNVYVPALRVQPGYLESKLIRIFPTEIEKKIQGEATTYNYQLFLSFDTEANRQKWVASKEHVGTAWPAAEKLAKSYKWRGYDVVGDDNVKIK
ncbi:cupin domain-containing protein [Mucilaginibacter auburnensis]|uniref:Cupin domain-containing protein n=1 Tax=Mucilaginibacter auburnensis TaxID=1457233 RepID=A0A2H9VRY2_9SPHI|nr:cupin domain-containing protein [Mucilaginibacter auburnensis]PJJ83573.1 Cupin domain-containing protein [Mucilaginibacter auburnensis]